MVTSTSFVPSCCCDSYPYKISSSDKLFIAVLIIFAVGGLLSLALGFSEILNAEITFTAMVGGTCALGISSLYSIVLIKKWCSSADQANRFQSQYQDDLSDLSSSEIVDFSPCVSSSPSPRSSIFQPIFEPVETFEETSLEISIKGSLPENIRQRQKYECYRNCGNIQVIWEDMKSNPLWHLNEFVKIFKNRDVDLHASTLRVKYLRSDGSEDPGWDQGGPSRNYISDLFSSVLTSSDLVCGRSETNGLYYPEAHHPKDQVICRKLGEAMCICFHMHFQIGAQFDTSVFATILKGFECEDLNKCYEELTFNAKFKAISTFMYNATVEIQDPTHPNIINEYSRFLDILQKKEMSEWMPSEVKLVLRLACGQGIEIEETETEFLNEFGRLEQLLDGQGHIHLEEEQCRIIVNQYHQLIKKIAFELFEEKFEPRIKALYALSSGFKSTLANSRHSNLLQGRDDLWKNLQSRFSIPAVGDQLLSYIHFMETIQGSIDKDKIARKIVLIEHDNEEIRKKANWLKKWIQEEASLEELKSFLVFATGGASLPHNQSLFISCQAKQFIERGEGENNIYGYTPLPVAHTCSFTIDLAPEPCGSPYIEDENHDRTYPAFVKCLQGAIQGRGYTTL